MWETIVLQIIQNIIVPELSNYIQKFHETTGVWPTKEQLEAKANVLADRIKREGLDFLNRPTTISGKELDTNLIQGNKTSDDGV